MNVLEILCGLVSIIIGGYSSWWLLSNLWEGITTSNWTMVAGMGILAYILLSTALALVLIGFVLIFEGLYN